ncbi:hypothetical protein OG552_11435 [Streptomyces sp. NBC_01476]|uniref:hypothetical protein n=1 Tax=Streptomyces sp. NBC_01476 TaxID=2903881 RepID=UPI002E34472B|nr:hypothetical protein [Streptomyces sp. NBC_01476]
MRAGTGMGTAAGPGGNLAAVLEALARCVGTDPVDAADEHERWGLYARAAGADRCSGQLFEAVGLEPDPNVALGIVLRVMGELTPAARTEWVAQLSSERDRAYAARRAAETGILQSGSVARLLQRERISAGAEDLWSDWLQLRLAECSGEVVVLRRLAMKGRTKRIRRLASRRLRTAEAAGEAGS